jgi:hypothetical protein
MFSVVFNFAAYTGGSEGLFSVVFNFAAYTGGSEGLA